jgi:hypothetical protein
MDFILRILLPHQNTEAEHTSPPLAILQLLLQQIRHSNMYWSECKIQTSIINIFEYNFTQYFL